MASKDAEAVRTLLNGYVKYRRNLIDAWIHADPKGKESWDEFTRVQPIIEALQKLEEEEKTLP